MSEYLYVIFSKKKLEVLFILLDFLDLYIWILEY